MSKELLDRIFDPFYTTKGSLGTGLGLPVVRDIARSLGGEIMLSSVVDKGTTVTVALPKFRAQTGSRGFLTDAFRVMTSRRIARVARG